MANGRCRIHGGKSPNGAAVNTFKTGKYSRHLPERLLEKYREALSDPELLAAREEIALADARLGDLLSRVDTGESGSLWRMVQKAWVEFQTAEKLEDQQKAINTLDFLIEKGVSDYAAWDEVFKLVEQRRKSTETEHKRLEKMQQFVANEDVMVMVSALVEAVKRHVSDRDTLQSIATDIQRLLHNRARAS